MAAHDDANTPGLPRFVVDKIRYSPRMRRLGLAVALLVACDSTSPRSDGASMIPDINVAACSPIGMRCTTGCPSGFECINDACAPVRGDCGGFAGADCQDTSLVCTYPTGSSGGICMRSDEKACVCAISPSSLSDCAQPP